MLSVTYNTSLSQCCSNLTQSSSPPTCSGFTPSSLRLVASKVNEVLSSRTIGYAFRYLSKTIHFGRQGLWAKALRNWCTITRMPRRFMSLSSVSLPNTSSNVSSAVSADALSAIRTRLNMPKLMSSVEPSGKAGSLTPVLPVIILTSRWKIVTFSRPAIASAFRRKDKPNTAWAVASWDRSNFCVTEFCSSLN